MTAKILEALAKLDPVNDNHWTKEGKPQLMALRLFAGDQALTQDAVDLASPGFMRPLPNQGDSISENKDASVEESAGAGNTDAQSQTGLVDVSPELALKAAQKALVETQARKTEADKAHDQALAKVDQCIDALTKAGGNPTLASHLNDYYARQKQLLAERVVRKEALKGIDLKDLIPGKSPIDLAMARKTARGGQRPVHKLG